MSLSVYNTLTKKTEPFKPVKEGHIGIYACGVTVYDICHIGHAMQAIIYDVIRNYFEFEGYRVTYIRNFTDVDDKIIERANKLGIPALEHSENMIQASRDDMAVLGVKPATYEPKVSDHIPDIIALIESLVEQQHAYAVNGNVYYDVTSYEGYGKLSNRCIEDMQSGARIVVNEEKKHPGDFALWKKAKPGEVSWESPWGEGRPGWHIECSAISMNFLGTTFDIHGGGKDLIFPHHENEIAQSEGATQQTFANYWIHNGLVTVENRKMSKSYNNFLSIRDAVAKYDPETIRYTILSHHYSANIDFSEKSFYDAYSRLIYFYSTLERIDEVAAQYPDLQPNIPQGIELPQIKQAFRKAMNDDFNTAIALREIGAGFKFLNDLLTAKKPKLKQKAYALVSVAKECRDVLAVLGLAQRSPEKGLADIQEYLIAAKNLDVEQVEAKVQQREEARLAKDWTRADEIRDALIEEGICIMDTPNGTKWQVLP